MSSALMQQGIYSPAMKALLPAQKLYLQLKDTTGLFSILMRRGDILRQQEKPVQAQKFYRQAQKYADNSGIWDAKMGQALCNRSRGRFRLARNQMVHVLSWYQQQKDDHGVAYTMWALATTDRFLGDFQSGEKEARSSLRIYRRLKDKAGEAYASAALGGILRMKGWAKESGRAYQHAQKIFIREEDQFGEAYSSCGIANSFRMQKKYSFARPWSKKAETLYRRLKMEGPLAYVLWSQSQMDLALRRKGRAFMKLRESTRLFKKVRDQRGLVYAQLGRGEFFRIFSPAQAPVSFKMALKNSLKLGLAFETRIARWRLNPERNNFLSLQKSGVDLTRFSSYLFLP